MRLQPWVHDGSAEVRFDVAARRKSKAWGKGVAFLPEQISAELCRNFSL